MDSRVSSVLAPSGFAAPASSGFPESCICGWVDDDSRSSSNFASSARLRMNLRIQSGFAHFRPTLDAFSQYHSGSTCRQADLCTSDFNCILHRLPSRNCVSTLDNATYLALSDSRILLTGIRSLVRFGIPVRTLAHPVLYLHQSSTEAIPQYISRSTSYHGI